jgi:hypothetical protein
MEVEHVQLSRQVERLKALYLLPSGGQYEWSTCV